MSETCTECHEPAAAHAPTCWLGPRGKPASQDDGRPDEYQFSLVSYQSRRDQWFGVIKLPVDAEPVAEGEGSE